MDGFDEKRGMVKKLLAMLKNHASSEVDNGLQKPEGEGDMHGLQIEKVEVLPGHVMDHSTPEHDVDTKLEDDHMAEGGMAYSKGGVLEDVSDGDYPAAPSRKIPYERESGDGKPEMEGATHGEVMKAPLRGTTEELQEPMDTEYSDAEEEPSSMFKSFLSRKRKK
jgi:hypothetical protein